MTTKEWLIQNNELIDEAIQIANSLPDAPSNIRREVNFYDYDGTLLYGYTVEQAQSLTALPPLPTHDGLTCQGWNYDLATIKSYNAPVDVGALYVTDDGTTRLYIRIASDGRMTVSLNFSQTIDRGVIINWGDNSAEETVARKGDYETLGFSGVWGDAIHTYPTIGDYVITLKPIDGCQICLGTWDANIMSQSLGWYDASPGSTVRSNMIQKVELGSGVYLDESAFGELYSLRNITLPNGLLYVDGILDCSSLQAIIFPNQFQYCSLMAQECTALKTISIPNTTTKITNYAFYNCTALTTIVIPRSVTSIESNAFANCTGMAYYDFTSHTSVPTLANVNAFTGILDNCEIRVPAKLYNDWIVATNWSTYFYSGTIVPVKSYNDDTTMFTIYDASTASEFPHIVYAFEVPKNMTWADWVNSSYNTKGFLIKNDWIYEGTSTCLYYDTLSSDYVKSTDYIINNRKYYRGYEE